MPFSTYVQVILMIYNRTIKLISLSTSLDSTGNPKLFPKVAVPIYTPTSEQDLILSDFLNSQAGGCNIIFHWDYICISLMINNPEHLCKMSIGFAYIYIFFFFL